MPSAPLLMIRGCSVTEPIVSCSCDVMDGGCWGRGGMINGSTCEESELMMEEIQSGSKMAASCLFIEWEVSKVSAMPLGHR